MSIWNKLSGLNINDKEKFQKIFAKTIERIKNKTFSFNMGETEKDDYFIVVEDSRMSSFFVHIVPKSVYVVFKELQQKAPNQFLGFSVLAGKYKNKEVRVSCFGIQCNLLGKALIKDKRI